MMRTFLRGIGYIATVILALGLLFVAINWSDEPLRPEVQAALEWKVPDHAFEDNGFLILLGMNAPAGEDAGKVGKQMAEAELARYQTYLKTHQGIAPPMYRPTIGTALSKTKILCDGGASTNCVEFYLGQDPDRQTAILKEYKFLSDRLYAIQRSENYAEVLPPYPYQSITILSTLLSASKLEQLQAIREISGGNPGAGVKRLVANAQFSRRFLKESDRLLTHQIGLALVRQDMRILSELLEKFPQLARYSDQLAPMVSPIAAPEYSLARAFQYERKYASNFLRDTSVVESDGTLSSEHGLLVNMLEGFAFKRGASSNLGYDVWKIWMKVADADASHLDSALADARKEKKRLFGWGYGIFYLRNPIGKILLEIPEPSYLEFVLGHHNTDGYIRLVALQLNLLAKHVPVAQIPDALEKSGPDFRNPYTLQPMLWDAATSELRFEGRQISTEAPDKKKIYAVKLPQREP